MSREQQIQAVAADLLVGIEVWLQQLERSKNEPPEAIVSRTTMQAGIQRVLYIVYAPKRAELYEWLRDYGDSDHSIPLDPLEPALTEEEARTVLVPLLADGMERLLQPWWDTPLFDYRFTVSLRMGDSVKIPVMQRVHAEKRQRLLDRIHTYIQDKLEHGQYPTKPLDSFFLSQHIVDPLLYPELDAAFVLQVYEWVIERNKSNPGKLPEHRSAFIQAFQSWAEDVFLSQYYDISELWGETTYVKKETSTTALPEQEHLLALRTAFLIIRHEPSYNRQTGLDLLDRLMELGSQDAERMQKEGSGTLPADRVRYRNDGVELHAHDLYGVITVQIRREEADSYGRALDFICRLLETGAFRSYEIKLKSKAKHTLDIRGLANSQTHRFFANALQYGELYPQLERYARLAMTEFEWYTDTEGEKSCMPGTYAVFGLAMADRSYFPLVQEYIQIVDSAHQRVQGEFGCALIERYGVDLHTLPTIAACFASCEHGHFAKYSPHFETEDNLRVLAQWMLAAGPPEARHLVALLWGGPDKLMKRANSRIGGEAEGFALVAAAASRRKQAARTKGQQ